MRRFFLLPALLLILAGSVILSQSSVKNPHGELQWDCQDCHTTESWSQMRDSLKFDHAATGFHLVGAHAVAQCIGCHKEPVFSHVGTSCVDCHTDHHNGQLGLDCQNCHAPRDWQNRQSTLDLHAVKGFTLTGAHAVADCEACHRGHSRQEYAGTPIDCYQCHAEAYAATDEPNHPVAGFSLQCQECHSATSAGWRYAELNHPASFPLTGGHQRVACKSCHPTSYVGTPNDCYSCHGAEFAATVEPDHETGGFAHDCTLCHTTTAWQPAYYDHAATSFPLTGAHVVAACNACHAAGYAGTPNACFACHQTTFEGTTNPNHLQQGFSQECTTCHNTTAWLPSTFNHAATAFPLTGQHVTANCAACHATGYSGTPTLCAACHQSAYDATATPSHLAAGFPNTCQTCHSTNGWTPSTWDHDALYFPITTGAHVVTTCIDCHLNPASYATFSCTDCHQHNQIDMDAKHTAVNDYQYLSTACYSCHPRGRS